MRQIMIAIFIVFMFEVYMLRNKCVNNSIISNEVFKDIIICKTNLERGGIIDTVYYVEMDGEKNTEKIYILIIFIIISILKLLKFMKHVGIKNYAQMAQTFVALKQKLYPLTFEEVFDI